MICREICSLRHPAISPISHGRADGRDHSRGRIDVDARMRSPRMIEVLASQDIHRENIGLRFNPSENRHKKSPENNTIADAALGGELRV